MGASDRSGEGADQQLEGWWDPVEGTSSPDVHGKIEREINQGRDELDVLAKGIEAPAGSQVGWLWDFWRRCRHYRHHRSDR